MISIEDRKNQHHTTSCNTASLRNRRRPPARPAAVARPPAAVARPHALPPSPARPHALPPSPALPARTPCRRRPPAAVALYRKKTSKRAMEDPLESSTTTPFSLPRAADPTSDHATTCSSGARVLHLPLRRLDVPPVSPPRFPSAVLFHGNCCGFQNVQPLVCSVCAQPPVSSGRADCRLWWFEPRPAQNASIPQRSSLPLLSRPLESGNRTSCRRAS
jgi:hypothetical protein